jgi:hypothetical protein
MRGLHHTQSKNERERESESERERARARARGHHSGGSDCIAAIKCRQFKKKKLNLSDRWRVYRVKLALDVP